MPRPNIIPGMKLKGIGRKSAYERSKKQQREWHIFQARIKKERLEEQQRARANRPYLE